MITPTIIEIGFMQMDIYEHSWECMKFRKYALTAMERNRYWQMSMDLQTHRGPDTDTPDSQDCKTWVDGGAQRPDSGT